MEACNNWQCDVSYCTYPERLCSFIAWQESTLVFCTSVVVLASRRRSREPGQNTQARRTDPMFAAHCYAEELMLLIGIDDGYRA